MYNADGSEKVAAQGVLGNIPVPITTVPDVVILTTTLLTANGVYTGSSNDTTLTGNKLVTLSALSSIGASATNGFVLQQSDDSTSWTTLATQNVSAAVVQYISAVVYQRYWRCIYTNGGTAQTGTFVIYAVTDTAFGPVTRINQIHSGASVPVILQSSSYAIGNIGSLNNALPAGANNIGKVTNANDATTTYNYVGAVTTVVVTGAHRLVQVMVNTVGSVATIIYDNASAASGTPIGYIPSGAAIGQVLIFAFPAALGITIGGASGNAQFTLGYV